MVASWQAIEAIKVLIAAGDAVAKGLRTWDAWRDETRRLDVGAARDPSCPCCAHRRFEFLEGRGASRAGGLCGRNAVQLVPGGPSAPVDLRSLAERLRPHGPTSANEFLVRVTLEAERPGRHGPMELTVFADGRAVVRGTDQTDVARGIYARYVGA
jgi:adenylyltransferase/sulfurtransferase